MYNFHPILTTFPFALFSLCVMLEVISVFRSDERLQYAIAVNLTCAVIGVIAAFLSGYQASELANQSFTINDDIIAQHHNYGRLLLFASIPCLMLKYFSVRAKYNQMGFRYAYLGFLALSFGLTLITGYLGANLVFSFGAGVKLAQ